MAAEEQSGVERGFGDRSGWLICLGTVEILIGAFCALLVPLMLLSMSFSAATLQRPPISARMMIPSAAFYAAAAVFFIWMGIGTLKGRRWAWAIMLVVSWLWLILGLFGIVFWLMMAPGMFEATPPGRPPISAAVASSIRAFTSLMLAVVYLFLPGIFVLIYRREDVKATFELKDPQPRWTDRCPLPVLALCLMLGYSAVFCLVGLSYNAVPFFGQVLTGAPAAAVLVILAVALGFLAREIYRLRMQGWWGVVALGSLVTLSNLLTFRQMDMLDLYEKMGLSTQQLELIQSTHLLDRFNIPLLTGVWSVVGLGYLLYVRKYFAAGPGDKRAAAGM